MESGQLATCHTRLIAIILSAISGWMPSIAAVHADENPCISETEYLTNCTDCRFKFALKTNLIHDALLTPDIGVEFSLAKKWSLSAQWMYAWWSNDARHRYWRIRGGSVEARRWLGNKTDTRALTGHHIGIYGSLHTYDFEFGHTGYQSPELVYGAGVSYGYSIRIASRLNLDFSIKAGYSGGRQIKYHPECGTYVCDSHRYFRYWGPTGVEITLVWFPGRNTFNNPTF